MTLNMKRQKSSESIYERFNFQTFLKEDEVWELFVKVCTSCITVNVIINRNNSLLPIFCIFQY
jgi:hypothetical protein